MHPLQMTRDMRFLSAFLLTEWTSPLRWQVNGGVQSSLMNFLIMPTSSLSFRRDGLDFILAYGASDSSRVLLIAFQIRKLPPDALHSRTHHFAQLFSDGGREVGLLSGGSSRLRTPRVFGGRTSDSDTSKAPFSRRVRRTRASSFGR